MSGSTGQASMLTLGLLQACCLDIYLITSSIHWVVSIDSWYFTFAMVVQFMIKLPESKWPVKLSSLSIWLTAITYLQWGFVLCAVCISIAYCLMLTDLFSWFFPGHKWVRQNAISSPVIFCVCIGELFNGMKASVVHFMRNVLWVLYVSQIT